MAKSAGNAGRSSSKPLTLYHGTNSVFFSPDEKRLGSVTGDMSSTGAVAFWTTTKKSYAEAYARNATYSGGEHTILQTEFSPRKPYRTTERKFDDLVEKKGAANVRRELIAKGHDVIVVTTITGKKEYGILQPTGIKLKRV
jgi:hypothetical protein